MPTPSHNLTLCWIAVCLFLAFASSPLNADDAATSPTTQLADQPRFTDPTPFYPEPLRKKATVSFNETPLNEVCEWIASQSGMPVMLEEQQLEDYGIRPHEPWTDKLDNEPIYLLLGHLEEYELSWFLRAGVLHISTTGHCLKTPRLEIYPAADLLQRGFGMLSLHNTIIAVTGSEERGDNWQVNDGVGTIEIAGRCLVIRQTAAVHQEVARLLATLRRHGRQTFATDSPDHDKLATALNKRVSFNFEDKPFNEAIGEIERESGVGVHLVLNEIYDFGIGPETEQLSLKCENVPLSEALHALLYILELDTVIVSNRLAITSNAAYKEMTQTAAYGIGDLCDDANGTAALRELLLSLGEEEAWLENAGIGRIAFPKPEVLVIRATQATHEEVLQFLTKYRAVSDGDAILLNPDAEESETRYYRLPTAIATDLLTVLPELVDPGSWPAGASADQVGFIRRVTTDPRQDADSNPVDFSFLIITHRRTVHDRIWEVMLRCRPNAMLDQPLRLGQSAGFGGFHGFYFEPTLGK